MSSEGLDDPAGQNNVLEAAPNRPSEDTEKMSVVPTPTSSSEPRLFSHGFFDREIANQRKIFLKATGMTTVIMMVVIWLFLSIYWGSLGSEIKYSPNLRALVINRDNGTIGHGIEKALLDVNSSPPPHPTWVTLPASDFSTHESLQELIEPEQKYWIIAEIMQDATQKLERAQSSGDSSWDPTNVVTLIYSSARNYIAIPSVVLTPTQETLSKVNSKLSGQMVEKFLRSAADNADAIQTALRAPQTLSNSVGVRKEDIRPWDKPVAMAPTFVGLIYMVIIALNVVLASSAVRPVIARFLRFRSYVILRILTTVLAAIPLSLMLTLLNIPFDLPFGKTFPYGGGFMVTWAATFQALSLFGLVLESVVTLITPRFIGVFLIFFIVTNVSVANLPPELSPSFYKYGYAMPFHNLRLIYLIVFFNSGKHIHILKYFGILWAWFALIGLTYPFFLYWDYRRNRRAMQQQEATPRT